VSRIRAWLDTTPLAAIGLAVMREATGRTAPLEPIRPSRPARLRPDARIGFWALGAGVGTSTTAALVAQRSAAGGHPPLLVDLDRWTPSLALRARIEAATIADALVQPDRERELVSHWSGVAFLPGAPDLYRQFDAPRIAALLLRLASGALVVDLGSGAEALDAAIVSCLTRVCVVGGPRASQLQAVFSSRPLLHTLPCATGLVVVGVEEDYAALIASRAQLSLLGAVPADPYLARDDFAARAPTMRSIDRLIRAL
jgi:MinD-like ATPase involved in chromosome partitioning or flagellar assembly